MISIKEGETGFGFGIPEEEKDKTRYASPPLPAEEEKTPEQRVEILRGIERILQPLFSMDLHNRKITWEVVKYGVMGNIREYRKIPRSVRKELDYDISELIDTIKYIRDSLPSN